MSKFIQMFILTMFFTTIFTITACEQEAKVIVVEPPSMEFTHTGEPVVVKAQAQDISGNILSDIPLTLRSENTAIATISPSGEVLPVSSGTTSIIATAPNGRSGDAFVRVCLPQDIICDPPVLKLRVGTAAPLKCKITDCNGDDLATKVGFTKVDKEAMLKEGSNTFIGKKVGDYSITATAGGFDKEIKVTIGEQMFAPGMGPGSGGGGGGGHKKDPNKDPYNEKGGGQFDHILKNM